MISFTLPTTVASVAWCPEGWQDTSTSVCMKFHDWEIRRTWSDGQDSCRAQGGELASVRDVNQKVEETDCTN